MRADKKDSIAAWSAVAMLAFGAAITAAGFCVPPVGIVHDSVLWILGQTLIYSGSIFGITIYTRRRMNEIEDRLNRHLKNQSNEENQ